jgi:hypothetical protein
MLRSWLARRREDKRQLRELLIRLETLVDPTFLDRATAPEDFELPKYNAIFGK